MTTKCAAGRPLKYIDPWGWYHDDDHISDRGVNFGHGTPCDHDLEPADWDWEKAERNALADGSPCTHGPAWSGKEKRERWPWEYRTCICDDDCFDTHCPEHGAKSEREKRKSGQVTERRLHDNWPDRHAAVAAGCCGKCGAKKVRRIGDFMDNTCPNHGFNDGVPDDRRASNPQEPQPCPNCKGQGSLGMWQDCIICKGTGKKATKKHQPSVDARVEEIRKDWAARAKGSVWVGRRDECLSILSAYDAQAAKLKIAEGALGWLLSEAHQRPYREAEEALARIQEPE